MALGCRWGWYARVSCICQAKCPSAGSGSLLYEGPLATNGTPREKHAIRQAFHPQIAELFKQSSPSIHSAKFLNPCIWRMPFEQRARSQWINSRRQPPACVSRTTLVSTCSVELRFGITLQNLFLSLTSAFGMRHSQLRWQYSAFHQK